MGVQAWIVVLRLNGLKGLPRAGGDLVRIEKGIGKPEGAFMSLDGPQKGPS